MPKAVISEQDKVIREQIGISVRGWSASQKKKPTEIAKVGGVSLAQQYRIESGEVPVDALYLIKVAQHLGISLDALCGLTDAIAPRIGKDTQMSQANNQSGVNIQVGHQNGQIVMGDNNEKRATRRANPVK